MNTKILKSKRFPFFKAKHPFEHLCHLLKLTCISTSTSLISCTVCPISSYSFYMVSYYKNTTSWTYCMSIVTHSYIIVFKEGFFFVCHNGHIIFIHCTLYSVHIYIFFWSMFSTINYPYRECC